ncbi:MAG TPA: SDR family NAD(P)-dependent oxidoreductase [Anaeromyxobacteraceae bacterium]|nr:SDR family NAD(P)-dependent oxidoreductase [Anaeromyxobacteraceae bacterium]
MSRPTRDGALSAILQGALDRFRVRRTLPPLAPDERLDGKLALVTGGASGLGFATSVDLARRGARVLLADVRDPAGALDRAFALGIPGDRIEPVQVDLSDLRAVDRLAADLSRRALRLDRLVLNAGIVPTAARRTPQGLDEMMVVNYLSSFALVDRLLAGGVLPLDRPVGEVPRVVFVSSESHRWTGELPIDRLDAPRDGSPRRVLAWYGAYKLMLTAFAWELARRHQRDGAPRLAVFALCPGAMRTGIARELPGPLRVALDGVMRVFFQDPFDADEPVVHLACSRAMEGRTAVYLHKMAEKPVAPLATDPAVGSALWERSEALLARVRGGAR